MSEHPHLQAWQKSEAAKMLFQPLRTIRRTRLIKAITGSANERMAYCVQRAAETASTNFIIYGICAITDEQQSRQTDRIIFQFKRLERIANAAKQTAHINLKENEE